MKKKTILVLAALAILVLAFGASCTHQKIESASTPEPRLIDHQQVAIQIFDLCSRAVLEIYGEDNSQKILDCVNHIIRYVSDSNSWPSPVGQGLHPSEASTLAMQIVESWEAQDPDNRNPDAQGVLQEKMCQARHILQDAHLIPVPFVDKDIPCTSPTP